MKTVVHIIDGVVVSTEVPDDYIRCSISGEYRPPEEFQRDGQTFQTRTNCTRTYLQSLEASNIERKCVDQLMSAVRKMTNEMWKLQQNTTAGVSIVEYITMLQNIAASNPNARIVDMNDSYELDYPCIVQVDGYTNLYY